MGLLRLALAICVFFSHSTSANIPVLRADIAVEIFYVLSGFYMQLILSNVYTPARLGKAWFVRFYANRYIKLFPIYIFIAGLTIVLAGGYSLFLPGVEHSSLLGSLAAVGELKQSLPNIFLKIYLLFTNLFIFFQDAVMFMGVRDGTAQFVADFYNSQIHLYESLAIPQAWPLGIELSFYLLAPFLLRLSTRLLVIITSISLASKFIFLFIVTGQSYSLTGIPDFLPNASLSWGYRFLPFEMAYFLAGSLAYRYYSKKQFEQPEPTSNFKILAYILLIISVTLASLLFNKAWLCWLYPFVFAGAAPLLFSLFRSSHQDRAIGNLSYPFYMLHILCINISKPLANIGIRGLAAVAALVMTMCLSFVLVKSEVWTEKVRLKMKNTPL